MSKEQLELALTILEDKLRQRLQSDEPFVGEGFFEGYRAGAEDCVGILAEIFREVKEPPIFQA